MVEIQLIVSSYTALLEIFVRAGRQGSSPSTIYLVTSTVDLVVRTRKNKYECSYEQEDIVDVISPTLLTLVGIHEITESPSSRFHYRALANVRDPLEHTSITPLLVPLLTPSTLSTTMKQVSSVAGGAKIVRCPTEIHERLRCLNEAEIITLFTPFVPHPPSTTLSRDMDPFEPLGRALPRRVRHVPYRLDKGMSEMHADFLPSTGAIVIVMCITSNVIGYSARAFEQQLRFARDVSKQIGRSDCMAGVPVVVLLVDDNATNPACANAMKDFQALVVINEYTTAALTSAVRALFGK